MKTLTLSAYWSDELGKIINSRSLKAYPMEFHNGKDWQAIVAAINQGIDSHLQAVEFTQGNGEHGRNKVTLAPQSVSVLVRRLFEAGTDESETLARDICGTLDIELV